MSDISRPKLYEKLNGLALKAMESAFVFCKLRGNPYVELDHWLHQMLQLQDSDLHRIVRHFQLNPARLAADMSEALDRLPRGAASVSDLSVHVDEAVERAWVYASLVFGATEVRTGHLVLALLKTPGLDHVLHGISGEFKAVRGDVLKDEFREIVGGSPEDVPSSAAARQAAAGGPEHEGGLAPAALGRQEALQRFTVDLTEKARRGDLDPVVGRDEEIRQIVDILMRRRQNNPILTGEAGVGKTAIVEGFAQRVASGDVPPPLKDVVVRILDLGLLQAGASVKGEFENRLRQVIEEVQASPRPVILFIDEAHTLVGAGGPAGQGDAANLLKPALARGTLRTIAATTWGEYKKYFEKDAALSRRFQVVKVDEPSEERALRMLRRLAEGFRRHHRVEVLDEALDAAVRLSHRYIPSRVLPDKAVSLLDTACARVAIGLHATPAEIEDCRRGIEAMEIEQGILDREGAAGVEHAQREAKLREALAAQRQRLAALDQRREKEAGLVARLLDLRAKLMVGAGLILISPPVNHRGLNTAPVGKAADADGRAAILAELKAAQSELVALQGERPLIVPVVDAQTVASVVSDWTGIPLGRMVKDEIASVVSLADLLEKRVIGQRQALETVAKRICTARAGFTDANRPTGVFLLVGPSGVGKTETALALAEALYGGQHSLITINMSEFQEAHTVSTLKGAPPGYVGYGEGGVLTEAVRRRPYSVVLLDEVEKAHRDVHEIFLQVFDKGFMEDSEGRLIDFKNTVILLTSNVGNDLVMNMCRDASLMPDAEGLIKALRPTLLKTFPAALLGRLVVVPYYPISEAALRGIIQLQVGRIQRRLSEERGIELGYEEAVLQLIAARCTEVESGARTVDAILTHTVLPRLSLEYLTRMMDRQTLSRVTIGVAGGEFTYQFE
jgi:type VI secretion system protein VasG